MFIALIIVVLLVAFPFFYLQHPKFGSLAKGERLERILQSPNHSDGAFQNLNHTPDLTEGVSYFDVLKEFIFTKKVGIKPSEALPSTKVNLKDLGEDCIVWFGHSSYFMQVDGKTILVDPVLSGNASPVSFTTKAFDGTDVYSPEDFPNIDYLFISHDHWDHLDYETIIALKPKLNKIISGLGTGAHFEHWGFDKKQLIEEDWNTEVILEDGFKLNITPGRHFSGRTFKRNQAIWVSFVLSTPSYKLFLGGDSGYDTHFKTIGDHHGPFDLAILENGQYDKSWKYIHMMPEEVVQAAKDLNAKVFLPVHYAKFALGNHSWKEPLERVYKEAIKEQKALITPIIGAKTSLTTLKNEHLEWWKTVD